MIEPSSNDNAWKGEWLSMKDLAVLLGKDYPAIWMDRKRNPDSTIAGIRLIKVGGRIRVRIDQATFESLFRNF